MSNFHTPHVPCVHLMVKEGWDSVLFGFHREWMVDLAHNALYRHTRWHTWHVDTWVHVGCVKLDDVLIYSRPGYVPRFSMYDQLSLTEQLLQFVTTSMKLMTLFGRIIDTGRKNRQSCSWDVIGRRKLYMYCVSAFSLDSVEIRISLDIWMFKAFVRKATSMIIFWKCSIDRGIEFTLESLNDGYLNFLNIWIWISDNQIVNKYVTYVKSNFIQQDFEGVCFLYSPSLYLNERKPFQRRLLSLRNFRRQRKNRISTYKSDKYLLKLNLSTIALFKVNSLIKKKRDQKLQQFI